MPKTTKEVDPKFCGRCGRRAILKPYYCMKCTKKPARAFPNVRKASKALFKAYPSLAITQDMSEGSELQKLRNECFLTGSMSAIAWNAKRGQTEVAWLKEKLGLQKKKPFSEFAQQYMKMGREAETPIAVHFWTGLFRAYQTAFGEAASNMFFFNPGMAVQKLTSVFDDLVIGATPDGVVVFYDGEVFRCFVVEIKFFASKTEIPDETPEDYVAQMLQQMMAVGTDLCVLWARAGTETPVYQWRVYKALPKHYTQLVECTEELFCMYTKQKQLLDAGQPPNFPGRMPKLTQHLTRLRGEMEIGRGECPVELLSLLMENKASCMLVK